MQQGLPSSGVSKSEDILYPNDIRNEIQTVQNELKGLPEPTRTRLAAYGLFAVASEENLPSGVSGRPVAMEMCSNTKQSILRLPKIQDSQRISSTRSEVVKRPKITSQ